MILKKDLQTELNRNKLILDYAREEVKQKDKEIQRLNNIINELEKASDEIFHKYPYERHQWFLKLKELKEGK